MGLYDNLDRFNVAREKPLNVDPDYDKPYGSKLPPITAHGNVNYQQFIDFLTFMWEKSHPELKVVPYGSRDKHDPQVGYIVYSLENKKPTENNSKPRYRHDIVKTDTGEFQGTVFSQSFGHLVEFAVMHEDPRTTEAILSAFEDFMIVRQPEFACIGVEQLFYTRRTSDRDMSRAGQDISSKSVMYYVVLQKQIVVKPEILEQVRIDARAFWQKATPDLDDIIYVEIPPVVES